MLDLATSYAICNLGSFLSCVSVDDPSMSIFIFPFPVLEDFLILTTDYYGTAKEETHKQGVGIESTKFFWDLIAHLL